MDYWYVSANMSIQTFKTIGVLVCIVLLTAYRPLPQHPLTGTTWLPIKASFASGAHTESGFLDAILRIDQQPSDTFIDFGTSAEYSHRMKFTPEGWEYYPDGNTIKVQVLHRSKDSLKVSYNDEMYITYIPFPEEKTMAEGIGKEVLATLGGNTWELNNTYLIEFSDTLDKRMILPPYQDIVKSCQIHYSKNKRFPEHEDSYFGVGAYAGKTMLTIRGIYDKVLPGNYFIESVQPESLVLMYFDHHGKPMYDTLGRQSKDHRSAYLTGKWQLVDSKGIEMGLGVVWGEYDDHYEGLTMKAITNNEIQLTLDKTGNYFQTHLGKVIQKGEWRYVANGELVELTIRSMEPGSQAKRNTYLTQITAEADTLRLFRAEDLALGGRQFEERYFEEVYRRVE